MEMGMGAQGKSGSIAFGPYSSTTNLDLTTPNASFVGLTGRGYSQDFSGPTYAGVNATALGIGAQARGQVSIAIGNRAMASGLHGGSDRTIPVERVQRLIVTVKETSSGNTISVTTNESVSTTYEDPAKWETYPSGNETYAKIGETSVPGEDGTTVITQTWLENIGGLRDPRYMDDEEKWMYDVYFDPGQGKTNYKDATYGVAVGYRSLAGAYHTLALGHYARACRPHAVAIGPTTQVMSEGSIGFGYYTSIQAKSPFSMAIGSVANIPSGMTNAIVIGVPTVDFSKRFDPGYHDIPYKKQAPQVYTSERLPKAMKSNSINFVFHGEGLSDVFVDDIPFTDRAAGEINTIGWVETGRGSSTRDNIRKQVNDIVGIEDGDESMVLFSQNGGIKIFTKHYLDLLDDNVGGDTSDIDGVVDDVEINGKPLSRIIDEKIQKELTQFKTFHDNITNQAHIAKINI